MSRSRRGSVAACAALALWPTCLAGAARAEPDGPQPTAADQAFALHVQATFVEQAHPAFDSPHQGPNSLSPKAGGRETADVTLYAGARLWKGAELWFDPEVDQGFGLSNTLGAAGFPSGEAYKVGRASPYLRVQRLFLRQTIDLGGAREGADADLNVLRGAHTAGRIVITVGKVSVADIFDANRYAHDPRGDFMNWTLIDTGTFDYAADAWGYTYGAAVEWYAGDWTLRAGAFDLSDVPNSERLDPSLGQFQLIGEVERRYRLGGRPGTVRLTGYLTRGRMGRFDDALRLAEATGETPSTALVRRYASRPGLGINIEQQITNEIGVFARGGLADGDYEAYEFTDVDASLAAGASLTGKRWGRPDDTVGLGGAVNFASRPRQAYLAAGGLGILVGDGRLPNPGAEGILETFYDLSPGGGIRVTADYQLIVDPAFNRDRGPVSVFGLRLHWQR